MPDLRRGEDLRVEDEVEADHVEQVDHRLHHLRLRALRQALLAEEWQHQREYHELRGVSRVSRTFPSCVIRYASAEKAIGREE